MTPDQACIVIYMSIHVSQLKKQEHAVQLAWALGQELTEEMKNDKQKRNERSNARKAKRV